MKVDFYRFYSIFKKVFKVYKKKVSGITGNFFINNIIN